MQTRKKRSSTVTTTDLQDRPQVKAKRRNRKYDFPAGYQVDGLGNLVPQAQSPRKVDTMSIGSLASSNAGSLDNLTSTGKSNSYKSKKIKPIVVNSNYAVLRNMLNLLTLSAKPLLKIVSNAENNARTQIQCANQDDKVTILTDLAKKKFAYHTYAEPGQQQKLFLIKHHHRVELGEMKTILDVTFAESDVKPSEPKFLYDHKEYPVYLVAFKDPGMSINVLRHRFKSLEGLLVTWDTFDNRRKRPMPCRRCKTWGHAASGCGHAYRCIKCTENHEPGNCARKDRNEGTPKCVNCKGPHIASSPECEVYKNYMQQNQRRRPVPIQRSQNHRLVSNPASMRQAFPGFDAPTSQNLNPHNRASRSYANIVSGSQNVINSDSIPTFSRAANYADAFANFASIPDIARTMELFNEMNAKLRATNDHFARIAILADYCTPRNGS